MLSHLAGVSESPPEGAPTEPGVLSVVIDDDAKKVRDLPSLYLGPQLLYTNRDLDRLGAVVSEWTAAIRDSAHRGIYTLRACSMDGKKGLYGRDLFHGSSFRRRLERLGFFFDPHPFVFLDDGCFRSRELGVIKPDFIILGGDDDDSDTIMRTSGAMLPFVTVTYRLGAVGTDELTRLVEILRPVPALSAARPESLVENLRAA